MTSILAMIIGLCTVTTTSPNYGPDYLLEQREKCVSKYVACYNTKGQDMITCTINKGQVK